MPPFAGPCPHSRQHVYNCVILCCFAVYMKIVDAAVFPDECEISFQAQTALSTPRHHTHTHTHNVLKRRACEEPLRAFYRIYEWVEQCLKWDGCWRLVGRAYYTKTLCLCLLPHSESYYTPCMLPYVYNIMEGSCHFNSNMYSIV